MGLKFLDRWQTIGEPLGEGGQGKVYRVIPYSMGERVDRHIREALPVLGNLHEIEDLRNMHYRLFEENLPLLLKRNDPSNHRALKTLHKPKDARDYELAEARYNVADQMGTSLAVTFGLMMYFSTGRWWVGVIGFIYTELAVRHEYKRPYIAAENAYWDADNADSAE